MHVTLLLADSAQVVAGKLFLLGAGWNIAGPGGSPIPMGVGIIVRVPWNETNQRHQFLAALVTEDGEPVLNEKSEAIRAEGEFEVGRPPGVKPGASFNTPFALQLTIPLEKGGYRWEVSVDGTRLADEAFMITDRQLSNQS